MDFRLALDIGTASCGLVALELGEDREPTRIAFHALHIFSEPVLPAKSGGVGEPKKAARRAARLARRVIDRRARRLKRIAMLANLIGLERHSVPADRGQTIHKLRALAATERIGLDDLLRVLLKLAKRRGYAGGFKTRKEGEEGVVEPGINQLRASMEAEGCKTLGEYLQRRFETGATLKLKEVGLYAHRDMLVEEFNRIWDKQTKHHPVLKESRADPVRGGIRPIREQFFDAIFFQRPLKSVAAMVGNCALEPSLPRAPMAQPAMQDFRIEKQLADLRWGMGRKAAPLTDAQKAIIRIMLNDPTKLTKKDGKLSFDKIYKGLEEAGLRPEYPRSLNMERSSREDLTGNRTLRAMLDLGALEQWLAFDPATQLRVINFLADLGSPEQVDQLDWHERFTKTIRIKNAKGRWETRSEARTLDPQLVAFINDLVNARKFDRMSRMNLETGRASYSIRALNRLTACMRDSGTDEYGAVHLCYPPALPTGELLTQLPAHKPTGNVVVDVALGTVRRAVNDALKALGEPPAEVVIELSRDMALGLKARGEIEKKIDKNRRARARASKELQTHGKHATERNVLRYLLWEQQETHCPYCAERISLEQAVDGNATHFEHILPRSLTRVGRQRNHLVLAHRCCNDLKGDRAPFEAFGHDEERRRAIEYCASILKNNKQFAKARLLTLADFEHEVLDDASITEFSERQFAETSWIGKLTAGWMKQVCGNVAVSRGTLTAHLRRIWKLETVIAQARYDAGLPVLDQDGEKITLDEFRRFKPYWEGHNGKGIDRTDRKIDKRIDHRHHLIDALVIAQTSRSLYQRMATHYKELAERRQAGEPVRMSLWEKPPLGDVRDQALSLVRNAAICHKPDRLGGGPFFQEFEYSTTNFDDDPRLFLCRRKKLASLASKKDSADRVRNQIGTIVSREVRRLVRSAFEARLCEGKTPFEALQNPVPYPLYGTSIKTVNCAHGLAESATVVTHQSRHNKHSKVLIDDGWACLIVSSPDGRKVETRLLSPRVAARITPRTAMDDSVVFFKGDTVRDKNSGRKYCVRQILGEDGGKLITAEIFETRNVDDMKGGEGRKKWSGRNLLKLQHA